MSRRRSSIHDAVKRFPAAYIYNINNNNNISLLEYGETSPPRTFEELKDRLRLHDFPMWEKYDICGEPITLNDHEYLYISGKSCKKRLCPVCASKKGKKYEHLILEYFKALKDNKLRKYMRFLTLTYENVPELTGFDFRNISKDLTSYHKKLGRFGYDVFAGFRTIEITKRDKGYHIHIHMLYFADLRDTDEHRKTWNEFRKRQGLQPMTYDQAFYPPHYETNKGYIYNQAVSDIWQASNHKKSYITKLKLVGSMNLSQAINYVTSYVTKQLEHNNELDTFIQMDTFLKNKKVFQKFGKAFKDLKFSCFKTIIYGISGQIIERGIIWNYKDFFKWEDVKDRFLYETMYFRFGYNRQLTLEENCILNAIPVKR